jgi:hypothetical protein
MARTDHTTGKHTPHREEDGAKGAARFLARPLILAVIVFILVVAFVLFLRGGRSDMMTPAEVSPGAAGIGTEPGGVAIQTDGAQQQRTVDPGAVMDNTSRSDNRPNILDAGEGADPAATVDELDVPDRVNPGVTDPGPPPAQN